MHGDDPSDRSPSTTREPAHEVRLPDGGRSHEFHDDRHGASVARTAALGGPVGRGPYPDHVGDRTAGGDVPRWVAVLPSLAAGGAERVILNYARGLTALGEEVTLIALDGRGSFRAAVPLGVPLVDLGRSRARWAVVPLVRRLRSLDPDVVLASQTHLNMLVCLVRSVLPRRMRLVLREPMIRRDTGPRSELGRDPRRAMRLLYPAADLLIASSEAMASDLRGALHRGRPRVVVLPNPVDVAGLTRNISDMDRPARDGRLFVAVGRLISRKGFDDLLRLFAAHALAGDRLVVVGDGPERQALESLATGLGLDAQVRFTGHVDRPELHVTGADALVASAHAEGMPNAVLEALAVGTPVLGTTDLPGLDDLTTITPPGALRLVPRSDLGAALGATPRRVRGIAPTTLLPDAFDPAAVARRLVTEALA